MKTPIVDIHTHRQAAQTIGIRTIGIHPWQAEHQSTTQVEAELTPAIEAIGEIGLDAACAVDHATQIRVFREQLSLAERHRLPVVLHCVRAFEETMSELKNVSLPAVIFHGFIGSWQQAQRALQKGYWLSFGARTFSSSKTLDAMRQTPINKLFVETDDSEIPVAEIYEKIALARGIRTAELQQATYDNYKQIFGHNG